MASAPSTASQPPPTIVKLQSSSERSANSGKLFSLQLGLFSTKQLRQCGATLGTQYAREAVSII